MNHAVNLNLQPHLPGGYVVGDKVESAILLCKSAGVLSGCPFFDEIFKQLNCEVEWMVKEGTLLGPGVLWRPYHRIFCFIPVKIWMICGKELTFL